MSNQKLLPGMLQQAFGFSEKEDAAIMNIIEVHHKLVGALRAVRNEYEGYLLNEPSNMAYVKGSRVLAHADDALAEAERI